MTVEDIKEYRKNAVKILERNTQYATARAVEKAFDTLIWFEKALEKFNSIPSHHEVKLSEDAFDHLKP